MTKAIIFPITTDGDRRNDETGVEIVRRRKGVYAVTAPQQDGGAYVIARALPFAEARKVAIDTVKAIREDEAAAPATSASEDDAYARRMFPSVYAMIEGTEDPTVAPAPCFVPTFA